MHTAAGSFQYQFLSTLLLLAMALVLASCAEGEKQSGTGSTEIQESTQASTIGGETTNTAEAEDSLPETDKIAFSRERGDASDIYTIDPNGSSTSRLTNDTYYSDLQPTWSPDGTGIAFLGGKHFSVMVMDADGFNQRTLFPDSNSARYYYFDLTWSPNGTKLAFDGSTATDGIQDIYTINSDGSNPTNLTRSPRLSETHPAFSPDGSRLCFFMWNQGMSGTSPTGFYVMNADGSNPTLLFQDVLEQQAEGVCDWSPDGTKIAFDGYTEPGGDQEVSVINANGSGLTNLTSTSAEDREPDDREPAWSPDGTKITFTRTIYRTALKNNPSDIYTMNADGSDVVQITKTPDVAEQDPDW